MAVKLEEIMAQISKKRQQKILNRVDELIVEQEAIDKNINSSLNLENKSQLNQKKTNYVS